MAQKGPHSSAFAKTTRPALSAVVPRERLFVRLDGDGNRTVAWISGPPGAGKTSLAASYVAARGYRALWYRVDADDADVATFFHYLGHAARKLVDGRSREFPGPPPQQGADIASYSRRFFRQLFARAKGRIAIVLDDLHAAPEAGGLHAALEAALAEVPRSCCVVVTSRAEPPASLARLRVTGAMACVGASELRVAATELADIARLRGQEISEDTARRLEERTQGWAAGIVLMLEHAKLAGRIAEFPHDSTPKTLFDYLAGEIFERFEPKTRQFLLRVACLPRMTAAAAEKLSGEPKAARLLVNLAQNDYFVKEAVADDGRMFEIHPLMREFLRSRAAQELPDALAAAHLERAAAVLRDEGLLEDAVALLIECRDWKRVAEVVAPQAAAMLAQGRTETLNAWLEVLPPEVLEPDARLVRALAGCRSRASPRAARRLFEQAFQASRRAGDVPGMLESACGVVNAIIFEFDDLTRLDEWKGLLAESLERAAQGGAPLEGAAAATLIRAYLLRDPGSPELDRWLKRAEAAAHASSAASAEMRAELLLAKAATALLRGELAAAGGLIQELGGAAEKLPPPLALAIGIAAALHHLLAGEHARAFAETQSCLAAAQAEGVHAYDEWLHALAACAALGTGERDAARLQLQRLEAAGGLRPGDRAVLHYLRGWLAVVEGDPAPAHRDLRAAAALAAETGMPWLECLAREAWAELLADAGDRRACEAQLRGAAELAERMHSLLLGFGAGLATAHAARQLGDEAKALEHVRASFALAREHGLHHFPFWRAGSAAELCALALRHNVEPEFARTLVRARGLMPAVVPLRVERWPWRIRITFLGGFSLEREGAPIEFAAKGPGRPVELLKVLIALGGQSARADQLADALWPHVDADYGHKSFTATLHRLRKMLGEEEALVLRDGRLSLNAATIWVDTWALDQAIDELDGALRTPDALARQQALMEETLELYRGPFLPDETDQPAYIACREQIRARLLRAVGRLSRALEDSGRFEAAADYYSRCIQADPLFEAPYRHLMLCLARAGDHAEARATYERLRTLFSTRLKASPSAETQAVFAGLVASS